MNNYNCSKTLKINNSKNCVKCLLEHIQELKYEDKPDYDMLMDVFKSAMQRKAVKESDLYDWEKESSEEESIAALQATMQHAALTTRGGGTELGLNPSQKNVAATTIAPGSLLTPYGDQNFNNNNNNMKDANFMNQELDSVKNEMQMNEDDSPKQKPQVNSKGLKVGAYNPPQNGAVNNEQLMQQQKKSRLAESEQKSLTKNQLDSNNSFKSIQNYQQQPVTGQMKSNNLKPSINQAAAAAAAVVANAASIAAAATSTNNPYHLQQQQQQSQMRLSSSTGLQVKQQLQQQQQSTKLKTMGRNKEDSQASVSCGSESNKNSRQLMTPQHQPIIRTQKQQQTAPAATNSGIQSFPSATPTTTAGVALIQNNHNTNNNNNNNNYNNKSSACNGGNAGSSQATNSCYTNNYARQTQNTNTNTKFNLNNSMDFTTPIGMSFY